MHTMIARLLLTGSLLALVVTGCSRCPTMPDSSSNRVVLTELFSYSACTYCPNAEEAVHRLKTEYGDSVAVLVYHMRILGDTLSPQTAQDRAEWYGLGEQAPIAFFDGTEKITGAEDPEATYAAYQDMVVTRRLGPSPLEIDMDAHITEQEIEIYVEGQPVSVVFGNLRLFLVLHQDSVPFSNSVYDFVVREIIEANFSGSASDTFHLVNRWQEGRLGAVAFVQDIGTKEVLQAVSIGRFRYGFDLRVVGDTLQTVPTSTKAVFHLTLENTGTITDVYELSLTVIDSVEGWFEGYCYGGSCYPPFVVGKDTLRASQIDSTISVEIEPTSPGTEVVSLNVRSCGDTTLFQSVRLYTHAEGLTSVADRGQVPLTSGRDASDHGHTRGDSLKRRSNVEFSQNSQGRLRR